MHLTQRSRYLNSHLSTNMAEKDMEKLHFVVSALHPKRTDVLKRKTLPWDSIILLIATTIIGLSISDALIEFLKPESSKVSCFVPTSNELDRDQYQYVNEFCNHALPYSKNFTVALVMQGLLLIAFHYIWELSLSNRVHSCFAYVSEMESIPRIDKNSGTYTERNTEIVQYIHRQLKGKYWIVVSYFMKMALQILLIIAAFVTNTHVFQGFNTTFSCEDSTNRNLFENVTCSYSKLQYIHFLQVVDDVLLGVSLTALIIGLYWCTLCDVTLAHKEIARFGYHSGILGTHYINCFSKWNTWIPIFYKPKWLPLRNDLHFIVFMLSLTNAELGRLFKDVQVFDDIFCLFLKDLEVSPYLYEGMYNYTKTHGSELQGQESTEPNSMNKTKHTTIDYYVSKPLNFVSLNVVITL